MKKTSTLIFHKEGNKLKRMTEELPRQGVVAEEQFT